MQRRALSFQGPTPVALALIVVFAVCLVVTLASALAVLR